jgi:hypothetical protein
LLSRHSSTGARPPVLFCDGYFRDRLSGTICPGSTLNHDPPDVCLLIS